MIEWKHQQVEKGKINLNGGGSNSFREFLIIVPASPLYIPVCTRNTQGKPALPLKHIPWAVYLLGYNVRYRSYLESKRYCSKDITVSLENCCVISHCEFADIV